MMELILFITFLPICTLRRGFSLVSGLMNSGTVEVCFLRLRGETILLQSGRLRCERLKDLLSVPGKTGLPSASLVIFEESLLSVLLDGKNSLDKNDRLRLRERLMFFPGSLTGSSPAPSLLSSGDISPRFPGFSDSPDLRPDCNPLSGCFFLSLIGWFFWLISVWFFRA